MILNTRPLPYHAGFQNALGNANINVVSCPVLTVKDVPWPKQALNEVDAIIVTSQMALEILSRDVTARHFTVYAVGPDTAAAARQAGFADVVDGGGTAAELLHVLDAASFRAALYLSAQKVSCDLALDRPDRIKRRVVYDMVPTSALPKAAVDGITSAPYFTVPFYSPRSLQVFETLIQSQGLANNLSNATVVVIHPRLLDAMTLPWERTHIAIAPNGAGMIHAIKKSLIHAIPEAA